MTSDLVERLRAANTWLNEGDCCGQLDASGTCMAPACIFGEALKLSYEAADEIERLRAQVRKSALDYLAADGQAADLMGEVSKLRAALRPLACTCTSKHPDGCSSGEVDCPFWNARAALDYRQMEGK